jgi:hypothetical protein
MSTLTADERQRLAKLLGMLGSDHQGERDNAAQAANRLVQQHGATWFDVVTPAASPLDRPCRDHRDPFGGRDWRTIASRCRHFPHLINAWEDQFLADVRQRSMLTLKQSAKLIAIFTRLRAAGCAI